MGYWGLASLDAAIVIRGGSLRVSRAWQRAFIGRRLRKTQQDTAGRLCKRKPPVEVQPLLPTGVI